METAYRTLVVQDRQALHAESSDLARGALRGAGRGGRGLLAHHWLAAADEDKAVAYLTKAGDRARQEYALDEAIAYYRELLMLGRRGEQNAIALVLFKLALAFHMSLRFSEANEMYQRAFDLWRWPDPPADEPTTRACGWGRASAERPRSPVGDRVAEHPAVHAAVRPARRGVAGTDDRAVARGAVGSPTTGSATCSTCARASRGRTANRSRRATSSSGSSGC